MKPFLIILFSIVILLSAAAQDNKNQSKLNDKEQKSKVSIFDTSTPQHDFDLLLNSSSTTSISVSVLFYKNAQCFIEYNDTKTDNVEFEALIPKNITMSNLSSNLPNKYRLCYKLDGSNELLMSEWYSFQTTPNENKPFCFTITADSHLDENCSLEIYKKVMKLVSKQNPSFHIDLGDIFMVDKYGQEYKKSYNQYLAQRFYLGHIGAQAPIYLVQGNHDGESFYSKDGMKEWSHEQRELFFPTPFKKNYYSLEQGNTLIIVLDPFGFSPRSSRHEPWDRTLGKEQYDWLKNTLKNSKATHRFVFIHNLVGGIDVKGIARGGAEVAKLFEWGGFSETGEFIFNQQRTGWNEPIHNLLKRYNVHTVFHGHDHVYAKQEFDGINYICLPQPGFKNRPGKLEYAREYGYITGELNNAPGFIKVMVNGNKIQVEYIDITLIQ